MNLRLDRLRATDPYDVLAEMDWYRGRVMPLSWDGPDDCYGCEFCDDPYGDIGCEFYDEPYSDVDRFLGFYPGTEVPVGSLASSVRVRVLTTRT